MKFQTDTAIPTLLHEEDTSNEFIGTEKKLIEALASSNYTPDQLTAFAEEGSTLEQSASKKAAYVYDTIELLMAQRAQGNLTPPAMLANGMELYYGHCTQSSWDSLSWTGYVCGRTKAKNVAKALVKNTEQLLENFLATLVELFLYHCSFCLESEA